MEAPSVFVGIDVSQAQLDYAIRPTGEHGHVPIVSRAWSSWSTKWRAYARHSLCWRRRAVWN